MLAREPEPILCFSSIDWDFIWQGHQEIMATLAARGHRVLFVENTGVRNPRMGDMGRIRRRFSNWRKNLQGFREERKNLFVYSPILLPFPYSRIIRRINRWLLLSALRRWMEAMEFYHPVCWTFLPTPLTLDLIHRIPHRLLIYYCIDSFADSTPAAQRIVPSERRLFREADLVFVTSHRLQEQASRHSRQVHLFPFGVSLQTFEQPRDAANGLPAEIAGCKRPLIGYVGGIHQWVDQELLSELARSHPDYTFMLVGPIQTNVEALRRIPNVVLTGQRRHTELPDYVRQFDVGLIPYRLTEYTRNVYPTKLNEYHILGKPVVSTPLPEIEAFNRRYGTLVEIVRGAEAFGKALQTALRDSSPDRVRQRKESAHDNSWEFRIGSMLEIIGQAIDKKQASPAEDWKARFRTSWVHSRRFLQPAIAVLLAGFLLLRTPAAWYAAGPLRLPERIAPTDAIVVFAGGVGESGQPGEGYQERVVRAVQLYEQGLAPWIVFVSGYTWTIQEAAIMRALAQDLGVPPASVETVTGVENTLDYVRKVRHLASLRGWDSILLVTSPYHTLRADRTFTRNAPELKVFQAPVSESNFYARNGGIRFKQIVGILHEWVALAYYRLRGWI